MDEILSSDATTQLDRMIQAQRMGKPGLAGTGCESDESLAAVAAAGDRTAFEALARRWWPKMGKYCAAAVGFDETMAGEASQDALVRLYGALPGFRHESSLKTFIYRICRNASIDLIRKTVRERRRTAPLPEETIRAGWPNRDSAEYGDAMTLPGPEDEFIRQESDRALVAAMARLKSDERALVYLKYAEGLGIFELAAIFGLPEGTVKSRLSRIRTRLAAMLKEEDHVRG